MKYESFDDLPGYIKDYCQKFGWSHEELEEGVKKPIPALGDKSILQALSDGQHSQVNEVILRTAGAIGVKDYF
jgi:hypothetical protein